MWANMFLAGRQLLAPGARVPLRAVWSRSLRTSQPACSSQEPRGEPAPARKVRPSKTAAKRGAQQWQKLASQLCQLSDRQLVSLRPLLDDRAVEAVLEAKGISGRSQARNRQEAFIAKVLREELDEEQQRLLEEAVASVAVGQGLVIDPAVEQKAAVWLEGLLAEDKAVATEVFGHQGSGVDMQRLRQLVRQTAQRRQELATAQGDGDGSAAAANKKQVSQQQRAENELRSVLRKLAAAAAVAVEDTAAAAGEES